MANPWFRMYAEFANDPKVQMLSETDQRRLTMIFCLRCNGHVTLQDSEVTFLLRISNDEWQATKALFLDKGFINIGNEVLNWDKRQFSSDTSKNRVAAYRERKKNDSNDNVTLQKQKSNAIDTEQNRTDTEQNINSHQQADDDSNISEDLPQDDLKNKQIPICPHQEIINLFAKNLPMGIQPRIWTDARQTTLRTRWREDEKRQNLDWWDKFFAHIAKSNFLTGKIADRDGRAFEISLDFIIKSANFAKIIEGKYDNKVNHG